MSLSPDYRLDVLAALADTIAARRDTPSSDSYTSKLLSQGVEKCAKKFGEEAVEIALASMTNDPRHITSEAADVLYHLLVLLSATEVPLADVMVELEKRFGIGGLEEKAARTQT